MSNNTIFDDVFRTMLAKMPELVIPLINEVFGTTYPDDIPVRQEPNENETPDGENITDSHFMIGDRIYHIECQSTSDGEMVIRMIEYDFSVALRHVHKDGQRWKMNFPHSCVLYLRGNRGTRNMELDLVMPDGQVILYKVPIILVENYTSQEIFQKRLLFLLPFYIIRYEKRKRTLTKDNVSMHALLEEYRNIEYQLEEELLEEGRERVYHDMIDLINRIADYIFSDEESLRKGLGDVMGGKILELESDKLIKKGVEQGRALEMENTERERKRADAAEAELAHLRKLLVAQKITD